MTYPNTHIVLYDGSSGIAKLDCPILFDGKSKDINLTLYGSHEIIYSAGAALDENTSLINKLQNEKSIQFITLVILNQVKKLQILKLYQLMMGKLYRD